MKVGRSKFTPEELYDEYRVARNGDVQIGLDTVESFLDVHPEVTKLPVGEAEKKLYNYVYNLL